MEDIVQCGEQPIFTILVAAYNASATIRRCLDSLLAQTERRMQIVCVDDDSDDDTFNIICEYSERDHRIEPVWSDENSGPAAARNKGLRLARGLYTAFLDSDDWLSPDALEKCLASFDADERVDCVTFNVVNVYGNMERKAPHNGNLIGTISGQEAFERSLTWNVHGWYAVRTSLHRRFPYDDSCRTYSDDNTTRFHYLHSRLVSSCSGTYYYFHRSGSVTNTCGLSRLDYLSASESMKRHLLEFGVDDCLVSKYETQRWLIVIDTCFFLYSNRKRLTAEEMSSALHTVRRHWRSIEIWRVARRYRWWPGLWPLRFSWRLFLLQEQAYFTLRRLLGRDR